MTRDERMVMYRNKEAFIQRLNLALTDPAPKGSNLIDLRYEVWSGQAKSDPSKTYYEEFVVLVFPAVECPICTNGNSDTANLRVVAGAINGGAYEDVRFYEQIKSTMERII